MSSGDAQRRPALRARLIGGGYRPEDVERALAELELTVRRLDQDLDALRERNRALQGELARAREEADEHRERERELTRTMAAALERAADVEQGARARAREVLARAEEASGDAPDRRLERPAERAAPRARRRLGGAPRRPRRPRRRDGAARGDGQARRAAALGAAPHRPRAGGATGVPGIEDVYVRRVADDRAVIELALAEPARLLDALRETLPYRLDVRSAGAGRTVVDLRGAA
jgi:cell division septum initiation protein DivIVA